ncbi:MAG TPA: peptide deformylase [Thermotogae bacterium]|nr:peptide deformylase [Thermotogota bacterium]
MEIKVIGDPVLRKKAKKINFFDSALRNLVEEMISKMYESDGVGLAAPQVGLSISLFVFDDQTGRGPLEVINPEILETSSETVLGEEGCLSVPGIYADVERHLKIRARFYDRYGRSKGIELEGYPARIFQHEYDHLQGVLFIDRIPKEAKAILKPHLIEIARSLKGVAGSR